MRHVAPRLLALALALGWTPAAVSCGLGSQRGTIGAVLGQQPDGRVFLREVPPDLAAGQAGLRPDDELLTIEGRDVRQMSSDDIHRALSGNVGDPVQLTLVRGTEVLRVTLERTPVPSL